MPPSPPASGPAKDALPHGAYALTAIVEGRWQVFEVPPAWLRAHWQGPPIDGLFFALLSPNGRSIADDVGPCAAPARLVAVLTYGNERAPVEVQLEYYDFCVTRKGRSGWPSGPQAFVQGIAVHVLDQGQVEIQQVFARRSDAPTVPGHDPATQAAPPQGKPIRLTRVVALEELYGRAGRAPSTRSSASPIGGR
jgi:hypothetical protein